MDSNSKPEIVSRVCGLSEASRPEDLQVQIFCDYPQWRSDLGVQLDIAWFNRNLDHRLSLLAKPVFVLYDAETRIAKYWTILDLTNGKLLESGKKSVVSLSCGAQGGVQMRVKEIPWLDTQSQGWPTEDFYQITPAGTYIARLEFDIYDKNNDKIASIHSNELSVVVK